MTDKQSWDEMVREQNEAMRLFAEEQRLKYPPPPVPLWRRVWNGVLLAATLVVTVLICMVCQILGPPCVPLEWYATP